MALPGVGPKMSHICLAEAFGVASGIGVGGLVDVGATGGRAVGRTGGRSDGADGAGADTHVHRIANDLRWVKSSDPEGTRAQLERFVPRAEWPSVNLELVGIGQMISQPAYRPRLAEALLELPGQDRRDALKMLIRLGFQVKAVGDEGLRARLSLDDEV
jgi:endonuclease-3